MLAKLEIYAIAIGAGLLLLALGTLGGYFKGRLDEKVAITQKQLADNAQAMQRYEVVSQNRADADDAARQRTIAFIVAVDQGLANVNAKFSKLPSVVLDARGCERLTPASALRWNATELLPSGPAPNAAGSAPEAVSAAAVPTTR